MCIRDSFMYSAATQRALSRLLEPYGMRYGSLTWPLYSSHVQHLLWSRYPDLSDLQYSCWLVAKDEAMCSRCRQCLRLAVVALAPFRRLKRRVRDVPPPPRIGVREGFCDWLDPELRERLVAIFRQHLPLEPR